jgi:hypothetical protein
LQSLPPLIGGEAENIPYLFTRAEVFGSLLLFFHCAALGSSTAAAMVENSIGGQTKK